MANTTTHSHPRPKRVRGKSERAQGLDPEFTAQPRLHAVELDGVGSEESGLSVDPDDLGSHFLHEAVEQGDSTPRDAADLGMSALEESERDDDGAAEDGEMSVWNRMLDLAEHGGSGDQLRDAAAFGADALDADREAPADDEQSEPVRLIDSSIREVSLLDREGPNPGETVSPEIDIEETGRHARMTPRGALGEQVFGGHDRPAADGGAKASKPKRKASAKAKIRKAAGKLRDLAGQLAHGSRR